MIPFDEFVREYKYTYGSRPVTAANVACTVGYLKERYTTFEWIYKPIENLGDMVFNSGYDKVNNWDEVEAAYNLCGENADAKELSKLYILYRIASVIVAVREYLPLYISDTSDLAGAIRNTERSKRKALIYKKYAKMHGEVHPAIVSGFKLTEMIFSSISFNEEWFEIDKNTIYMHATNIVVYANMLFKILGLDHEFDLNRAANIIMHYDYTSFLVSLSTEEV